MNRKPPIWKRCCDTSTTIKRWMRKDLWRETMTVARAVRILRVAERGVDAGTRSKINPALSQRQIWQINWDAVVGKPPDTKINPIIAKNIGREFGRAWLKAESERASQ